MSPGPDPLRAVGRRIAELRRSRGLTQEQLAALAKMGWKNYQRIEAGYNITLRTLFGLAAVLEVPAFELLRPVGARHAGAADDELSGLAMVVGSVREAHETPTTFEVPVLSLGVAAGYLRAPATVEVLAWCALRSRRKRPPKGTFVARVIGDSMQPLIPRGAWCVFGPVGSSDLVGRVLLVEHRGVVDSDTGGSFAVKRVASITGRHAERRVTLEPLNRRYRSVSIDVTEDEELRPVAELVEVLTSTER